MKYPYNTLVLKLASTFLGLGCGGDEPPSNEDDGSEPTSIQDAAARDAGQRDTAVPDASRAATRDAESGQAPSDASADRMPANGSSGIDACDDENGSAAGEALHQGALEVLAKMTPCGFSACHSGRGKAGLTLLGATDLRALLVDQPACEAPALSLVDGSGGADALASSWLWRKLTSDVDAQSALPNDSSWGTPGSCGQQPDQPYGLLMPLDNTMLGEERLAPIRAWICAGAPGPLPRP